MVDQAPLKSTNGRGESPRSESPPRAVARSAAEFVHDVLTLAELQGKLFVVDFENGLQKLIWPAIGLAVGAVLALCCVPLALATLALVIDETTRLTLAQSFGMVLGGAVLVAALLIAGAVMYLRHGWSMFDRSWTELSRNLQWSKEMLRRLGRRSPAARDPLPAAFD
jgi:hypothetical protein